MHVTRFAHHRLDAFHVARSVLVAGDLLVRKLPRGYGPLGDQLRRALLGTDLQLTEAASRDGNDRRQRFRCARGECNEAAAGVEAAFALGFLSEAETTAILTDLDRLAAVLNRTTSSTRSSESFRCTLGRGASDRPSRRHWMMRFRYLPTVWTVIPSAPTTPPLSRFSAQARTIRARGASPCETVRPRAYLSRVPFSSAVSSKGSTGRPVRRFDTVMTVRRSPAPWINFFRE
jgi:four helix bundle protein